MFSFVFFVLVHRYDTALPSSPVAVNAVEITATTVRLTWASGDSETDDPAVSYSVAYETVDGGPATGVEVTSIPATEYRISGLSAYTTYRFRVVAVNSVGRGLPSSPLEVTTEQLGQLTTTFFSFVLAYHIFPLLSIKFSLHYSSK